MLAHAMAGSRARQTTRIQNTRNVYYVPFYSRRERKVMKASRKYGTPAARYTRIRQINMMYYDVL